MRLKPAPSWRAIVTLTFVTLLSSASGMPSAFARTGFCVRPPAPARVPEAPQAKTYHVNDNGTESDSFPDGVCLTGHGYCTLRAALEEANQDGVESIIHFSGKFQGTNRIQECDLSITADGTTIDASDQWDTGDDRPGVELFNTCLFLIKVSGSYTVVRGLNVTASASNNVGIYIQGGGYNTIGGSAPGQRNTFIGQGLMLWSGEGHNQVLNNYFGTVNGSNGAPGDNGLLVQTGYNTIAGNLFLGVDEGTGIDIFMTDFNQVHDNRIGLGPGQISPAGLDTGIRVFQGDNNTIGPANQIFDSDVAGISIENGKGNSIVGNIIGGESPSSYDPGNHRGIYINGGAEDTLIKDNQIHGNNTGVSVAEAEATLKGNHITGGYEGLNLYKSSGLIGGSSASERNVISGCIADGVRLTDSSGVTIIGNCIGLAENCIDDMGNGRHGIHLDDIEDGSSLNYIGGEDPGEANWIAWNHEDGIHLSGARTQLNFIWGNVLGAPSDWSGPAPNVYHGIHIRDGAGTNVIGGLAAGQANTILASGLGGVVLLGSENNVVSSNRIGTDGSGHNWGNGVYGIYVSGADNTIHRNQIAHNGSAGGGPGVLVTGAAATGNGLLANSIHNNAGLGISLTYGGNEQLAAPDLATASCDGPVAGSACAGCSVEIFSDSEDEGRVYEGQIDADATSGAFSWSGTVNGPNVTATATDADGNTSQFSDPLAVGMCNTPPTAAFTVQPSSGPVGLPFTFDASSSSDAEDPASALEVRWDLQNDSVYETGWSTDKTVTHSFDVAATHTIRLEVRDTGGLTDATTRQLVVEGSIPNQAPVADAGPDQTVAPGAQVSLDGSGSTDPDDDTPLAFAWQQTGGPAVSLSGAATASPAFTAPPEEAVLTFSLTVTDSQGLASEPDTVRVTVGAHRVYLPLVLRNWE